MSKSAILSSSIAKKYWMALTGLFLCLFLVGHLIGNLQLILSTGEEGKRMFNEYAYFMTHNPFIKVLSYVTYLSIIFHSIDGIMLAIQNKKARPIAYAYNNPGANSKLPARQMALLGSVILLFIVIHMANFWGKMHFSVLPLHKIHVTDPNSSETQSFYLMTNGDFLQTPVAAFEDSEQQKAAYYLSNQTEVYFSEVNIKKGEVYKDLHSVTMAFFGQDKTKDGAPANKYALFAVIAYTLSMVVLWLHLSHGFSSAFQSLGLNHKKYTKGIKLFGSIFSFVISLGFAIIPIIIFLNK